MPYRVAAQVVAPPADIASKRIVRYSLFLQIFVLSWFVVGVVMFATVATAVSLECTRSAAGADPVCVLHRSKAVFWGTRTPVAARETALVVVHAGDNESTAVAVDAESFTIGSLEESQERRERFVRFLRTPEARTLDLPLRSFTWLYGLCGGCFLTIFLYFTVAQRRIQISIDLESGRMEVEHRARLRVRLVRTVRLDSVKELMLEELDEEARVQAVCVIQKDDNRVRLLEAMNVEAREAFDFIERARVRWAERHEGDGA